MFDALAKLVQVIGRNGEIVDVKKIAEDENSIEVEATVQVSHSDYRQNNFILRKTE